MTAAAVVLLAVLLVLRRVRKRRAAEAAGPQLSLITTTGARHPGTGRPDRGQL